MHCSSSTARSRAGKRGITLIELMIVVTIIGVLAVLAAVGYGRWVSAAKSAEAGEMVGAIKNAQENYYTQAGKYLDVSKGTQPPDLFPKTTGDARTPWALQCPWCKVSDGWQKLGIKSDKPVYFGYATVAGLETDDPDAKAICKVNGVPIKWSTENGGPILKPWYVVNAMADTNGNGVYATVCASSFSGRLITEHEGE